MKRIFLALSMASLGLAGTAVADSKDGNLVSVSEDATVFAVRAGETLSVSAGDTLFAGDRLITSGEGSVSIAFAGCTVDVPASNMVVLTDNFCDDAPAGGVNALNTQANLQGGALPVIAALVAAGAVAGIVVAATDDDEPTSP